MTQIIVIYISAETKKTNTTENQKHTLTLILDNYNTPLSNNRHKTLTGEHTNKKTLENYQWNKAKTHSIDMVIPQNVLYAIA